MTSDYEPSEISEDDSKKFYENSYNSEIRTVASRIVAILKDYSPLFIEKIFLKVTTSLDLRWFDQNATSAIIHNLSNALQIARFKEHQSGWFRSVLKAVCGDNISCAKVATLLGVDERSVRAAKSELSDSNKPYNQFIQKSIIKRVRIDPTITESIHDWMKTAFTPSSNSTNVVMKKEKNIIQWEVKHWRTESIEELYEMFCDQFEGSKEDFKIGYFRKLIPWFVRKRINYSGLCIKHDMGLYYINLLTKQRKNWHTYQHTCNNQLTCNCQSICTCSCKFCAKCKHGSTSSNNGNCFDNSCTNCCDDECPLEFTERKKVTWIEKSYEKVDGKLQAVEEEITTTRMYLSQRIAYELQLYEKHLQHVAHWKISYNELKTNLRSSHIIVRWDFIGIILYYYLFILQKITFMKTVMQYQQVIMAKNKALYWLQQFIT
jgi:hypothetical protein